MYPWAAVKLAHLAETGALVALLVVVVPDNCLHQIECQWLVVHLVTFLPGVCVLSAVVGLMA